MSFIQKLTNLLLYSSVFIALGAVFLVQLNMQLVSGTWKIDTYTIFVFFSTIAMYNAHSIIGIEKVKSFENQGRFSVIKYYRQHIILYGLIGMIGSVIFFFLIPHRIKFLIVVPAFFSMLYVLPIFANKKRLRDFHLVKIFTIAFVWAWTTAFIPEYLFNQSIQYSHLLSFAERFFFFLAITIPFDIRDLRVDRDTAVKTIPIMVGIKSSKWIALACLGIHLSLVFGLSSTGYFAANIYLPYIAVGSITALLIWHANQEREDTYYSGLLDGTMILQWLFVSFWIYISR